MKFLYIKDDGKGFKEYNFKGYSFAVILVALFALISFTGYKLGYNSGYKISDEKNQGLISTLSNQNTEKQKVNEGIVSDLDYIEVKQQEIIKRDNFLRSMIGLPQIDSDIYKMGTGGLSPKNDSIGDNSSSEINKVNYYKKVTNLELLSYEDISDYVNDNLDDVLSIPAIHPVSMNDCKVTSKYGKRLHPTLKKYHMHAGQDFAPISNFWDTEIYATANGKIKKSVYLPDTYGHYIEIDHGNGLVTAYAHLRVRNVRKGQKVKRGQKIGIMGSTGMSTSVHLHYEVKKNGKAVNPDQYFFDQKSL